MAHLPKSSSSSSSSQEEPEPPIPSPPTLLRLLHPSPATLLRLSLYLLFSTLLLFAISTGAFTRITPSTPSSPSRPLSSDEEHWSLLESSTHSWGIALLIGGIWMVLWLWIWLWGRMRLDVWLVNRIAREREERKKTQMDGAAEMMWEMGERVGGRGGSGRVEGMAERVIEGMGVRDGRGVGDLGRKGMERLDG